MTVHAAAILCFINALKKAAKQHQPRFSWRFEPHINIRVTVGGFYVSRGHYSPISMQHGRIIRLRRPPIIDGKQKSASQYFAEMSSRCKLIYPTIICKTKGKQLRLISFNDEFRLRFWIAEGWAMNDEIINGTRIVGLWSQTLPYNPKRHIDMRISSVMPVVCTNTRLEEVDVKLDITDPNSFVETAERSIGILHKSYEPAHGAGRSHERIRNFGLAVVEGGRNLAYDPERRVRRR